MNGELTHLSPDDIFHVLQTSRRRETIRYLLERDTPSEIGTIAEYVAAREHETTVEELTSAQRQRVYIPLYQTHLSKLDEIGAIEYDKSRGIVRPTERLEVFRPYLEAFDPERGDGDAGRSSDTDADPATAYYAAAIAVSTGLLLASVGGVLAISGFALGAIITALFAAVTIAATT